MTYLDEKVGTILAGRNDLFRDGLKYILEMNGFEVQAAMADLDAFVAGEQSAADCPLRLVILDEPGDPIRYRDEVAHVRRSAPDVRIVILRDVFDCIDMIDAFAAGVDGYVIKNISSESLVECLRLVVMGEKVMPSALAGLLPELGRRAQRTDAAGALTEHLSERELDTLRCLSRGDPNKLIARKLDISEATVKVHVKAILRKLGLHNRTQAAAWMLAAGLDNEAPPRPAQPVILVSQSAAHDGDHARAA